MSTAAIDPMFETADTEEGKLHVYIWADYYVLLLFYSALIVVVYLFDRNATEETM